MRASFPLVLLGPLALLLGCSPGDGVDASMDDDAVDDDDVLSDDDDVADDDDHVADDDSAGDDDDTAGADPFDQCFGDLAPVVTYDGTELTLGTHCMGTDHQTIDGVERVVFIGDSVTVGTPPTPSTDWWRNVVADDLVDRWGLEAPGWDWENVSLWDGMVYTIESGDFACCAKWGARTDDLMLDPHQQIQTCIPEDARERTNLVLMTTGGNDLFNLLEEVRDGIDPAESETQWQTAIEHLQDAVHFLKSGDDFPGGIHLVMANIFDVTDETGARDIAECTGPEWIGLYDPLLNPFTHDLAIAWQEEVAALAAETGSDLVFMGEHFCGHGYNHGDASGRCYRGGVSEVWYDLTCMHPSSAGHEAIAELFLATILE